jgi:hypothetical protein
VTVDDIALFAFGYIQEASMRRSKSPLNLPRGWQWLTLPVVVGSGIGYGVVLVQEEAALVECLPLAVLPGLAGIIYLLDHYMFRARLPRQDDTQHKSSDSTQRDT